MDRDANQMDLDLKDKVVVITGASKGIGFATAEALLGEGARVVLVARDAQRLNEAYEILSSRYDSDQVSIKSVDCSDEIRLREVASEVSQEFGYPYAVVANVGDGQSVIDPIPDADDWSDSWKTNFETGLVTARVFSPYLVSNNGSIVFVSSIAGIEIIGAPTNYSTAKAALFALAKNLSIKLAPKVRVNVVAPGNILAPGGVWESRLRNDQKAVLEMIALKVPLNRFGTVREIADAIVFLCSPRSAFTTGAILRVDGGQTVSIQ